MSEPTRFGLRISDPLILTETQALLTRLGKAVVDDLDAANIVLFDGSLDDLAKLPRKKGQSVIVFCRLENVLRFLNAGAYDTVFLPAQSELLEFAIGRAVERHELMVKVNVRPPPVMLASSPRRAEDITPIRDLEKQAILHALEASKGSVEKAAKLLGMGRATLYRRLASGQVLNPLRIEE